MKICKRCKIEKEDSFFNKERKGSEKLQSYCKQCMTEYNRERTKNNPGIGTDRHYRRVFGISLEDVKQLLKKQDSKCLLCNKQLSLLKGRGFLNIAHVDHCHKTGKIRGILCGSCNTSLGKLGDSIEAIEKVLKYLKGELNV